MDFFFGGAGPGIFGAGASYEFNHQHQQQQQQQQPSKKEVPPASRNVINNLQKNIVKITADDLIEASNRECAFCLDEQKLGSTACKLQCGHLYHLHCIKEWLELHCTCPICRFELPTDDTNYEYERKKRMKSRKPRFRSDELLNKKVFELKDLAASLGLNITGFIDKKEIVDYMVKSGKIDVTEGVPVMEFSEDEFHSKSVAELRNLLKSFGLSDEGALEKKELRTRLIESNRVMIVKKESSSNENTPCSTSASASQSGHTTSASTSYGNSCRSDRDCSSGTPYSSGTSSSSMPSTPTTTATASTGYSRETLRSLPLSQLKLMAQASGVSVTDCREKEDIVEKLVLKVCPT